MAGEDSRVVVIIKDSNETDSKGKLDSVAEGDGVDGGGGHWGHPNF